MWKWMSGRPRCAVKIGLHDVAWAEVCRDWSMRARYRTHVAGLPDDMVRPSPLEPNLLRPTELQQQIRELSVTSQARLIRGRHMRRRFPRAVTLIVPDLAVRIALLHLQDLPVKPEEREALIRWRLGQDQLCSLIGARLYFQILPGSEQIGGASTTVIAVVAQEEVVQQYEAVCEAADLLPLHIEVSSLALFNLWVRSSGGLHRVIGDFLWVNVSDGGFTALVFHKGHLVFQRTKRQAPIAGHAAGAVNEGPAWVERIVEECAASIYACQQRHPMLAATYVVLVGGDRDHPGLSGKLGEALGLAVKEWGWDDLRHARQQTTGVLASTALPAMAGL